MKSESKPGFKKIYITAFRRKDQRLEKGSDKVDIL